MWWSVRQLFTALPCATQSAVFADVQDLDFIFEPNLLDCLRADRKPSGQLELSGATQQSGKRPSVRSGGDLVWLPVSARHLACLV